MQICIINFNGREWVLVKIGEAAPNLDEIACISITPGGEQLDNTNSPGPYRTHIFAGAPNFQRWSTYTC